MIGSIGHELIDGSIELALIRERSGAEIAVVLDSIKVAFLLNILEEISPNDQILQGLNGLVPVSLSGLDVALVADLLVKLVEPFVKVFIIEEVEMLIVLLELYLSDFRVADIRFRRRWQFDLINHVTKYLSYLFFQDLLLDLTMKPAPSILPFIQHKGLPAKFDVWDLGL